MENSIPSTNNIKTLMKEVMERLFCCCMMKKLFLYHLEIALCPQVTLSIKKKVTVYVLECSLSVKGA